MTLEVTQFEMKLNWEICRGVREYSKVYKHGFEYCWVGFAKVPASMFCSVLVLYLLVCPWFYPWLKVINIVWARAARDLGGVGCQVVLFRLRPNDRSLQSLHVWLSPTHRVLCQGLGHFFNLRLNHKVPEFPFLELVWHRAVEPDFKKSNKKSDAQGACRRLYPTFA